MYLSSLLLSFFSEYRHITAVVLCFAVVILLICTLILTVIVVRYYRSGRRKKITAAFDDLMSEVIIAASANELEQIMRENSASVEAWLRSPYAKSILVEKLAEASNGISGMGQGNIFWLYEQLGLRPYLLLQLKSRQWHRTAAAIQKLTTFREIADVELIKPFINSRNVYVRGEAQTAIVKLLGFDGLSLLCRSEHAVSEWQQLCLMNELGRHQFSSEEQVRPMFYSTNFSLLHLALKLAGAYRCYSLEQEVMRCLVHEAVSVRQLAAECMGNIMQPEMVNILAETYNHTDTTTSLSILRAFSTSASEAAMPFLLEQLHHGTDAMKLAVAETIAECTSDAVEKISAVVPIETYPWPVIIEKIKGGHTV